MNRVNQSTICAESIWKTLTRATVDKKHPWRVVGFCTAGVSGPDSRHVILRSVDSSLCELYFYTDVRSQKVKDLQHNDAVALLFWNPKSREQLRVKGVAEVVGVDGAESAEKNVRAGELWTKHWAKVPDHAKRDYATVEAPGTVLFGGSDILQSSEQLQKGGSGFEGTSADSNDFNLALAKENFRVIHVVAQEMDYLRLDREGHERKGFVWKSSAGWQVQHLVP